MKNEKLYNMLKSMMGYKAMRKQPNGSTWVKLVSEHKYQMYNDISVLKIAGYDVEIIKDEPLIASSNKQYITFYVI